MSFPSSLRSALSSRAPFSHLSPIFLASHRLYATVPSSPKSTTTKGIINQAAAERVESARLKAEELRAQAAKLADDVDIALQTKEGRRRLNEMPIVISVYDNPVPYRSKNKDDTLIEYIQHRFGAFYQSRDAMTEYFKTPKWSKAELMYRLGFGEGVERRSSLLKELEGRFEAFKKAEVIGDRRTVETVSCPPIRQSVMTKLNSPTRNSRLRQATWTKTRSVSKPKLISFFRMPIHPKLVMWQALVRFHTEQTIQIPATKPTEQEIVKTQTLVEDVLFERRDWLEPKPDWRIRDFVPTHGIKEDYTKELPIERFQ
ncbi:hypothetical protein [Phaffia rhodozyma]|uniref:Uncharacterized protein n=1 Tax=Phaffia rhodozyma TaxID=264483 RepID=A0A0F7SIW1_PHARH|nr:hypothetical protein [Phaffia rhodozyma]